MELREEPDPDSFSPRVLQNLLPDAKSKLQKVVFRMNKWALDPELMALIENETRYEQIDAWFDLALDGDLERFIAELKAHGK